MRALGEWGGRGGRSRGECGKQRGLGDEGVGSCAGGTATAPAPWWSRSQGPRVVGLSKAAASP